MIAVDTSSFIAYLQGEDSVDVRWIDDALKKSYIGFSTDCYFRSFK
jgi:hypothetical protein